MWDNRVGKRNPKAPDYKCRDKDCNGAIWLKDKNGKSNAADIVPNSQLPSNLKKALTKQSLSAHAYIDNARRLLAMCHKAAQASFGIGYDHEDARTLFITTQRAGYVETLPPKQNRVPEPEPEPEPEPLVIDPGDESEPLYDQDYDDYDDIPF